MFRRAPVRRLVFITGFAPLTETPLLGPDVYFDNVTVTSRKCVRIPGIISVELRVTSLQAKCWFTWPTVLAKWMGWQ